MKKIFKLIVVIMMYNATYGQTVRELKYRNTDNWTYNPIAMNSRYYKDIYNYFTPFLGQWKYENGNQTFIVTLWKDTRHAYPNTDDPESYEDSILGHYIMYQNYGQTNQVIVYNSNSLAMQTTSNWPFVIFAKSTEPNKLGGHLFDINTEPPTSIFMPLRGGLTMIINSGTSPLTAQWIVSNSLDMGGVGQNRVFVIPTNITLTKI